MKHLVFLLALFISFNGFSQEARRELKTVTFSGEGYALGLEHGKALKNEIAEILKAWKKNTANALGRDANLVLKEFFNYATFDESIKSWTPELYEEVRGIAEGSNQPFNDIMVLNLLDEFWVYIDNLNKHHCSGAGIPSRNGRPGYISQNMDLESYTDGFQVLMRLKRTDDRPEQLILTHPGLIALNGLNEQGIGVCVNTLMQLKAASKGLPVAFVVRRIVNSTDKDDLLNFIQQIDHASGQNYLIGIRGEIFDFEASANKVVRFDPKNENGSVYHTNHPLVNDDVKSSYENESPSSKDNASSYSDNSRDRFKALESRLSDNDEVTASSIIETLKSRDSKKNPVCITNNGYGFTFASVVMTMSDSPSMQITAGPPDESAFIRFEFTANQK